MCSFRTGMGAGGGFAEIFGTIHARDYDDSNYRAIDFAQDFVIYKKLFNNFDNVKAIFENMSIIAEWFEEVRVAINNMWTKLKIHYTKTKNPLAYVDVNILHPGKKLHLFKKKDSSFMEIAGQIEIYKNGAHEGFDKLYNSISRKLRIEPSNSLKRKRAADSDDSDDDDDQSDAYNEFDHYL